MPVCVAFVRREVLRRGLPARDFAPDSRFGGTRWEPPDFEALASDWALSIRGRVAGQLAQPSCTPDHIANLARVSVRQFLLRQQRQSPRSDLVAAVNQVLPEFPQLLARDSSSAERRKPNFPFPWQSERERSSRSRFVTCGEVRAALTLIRSSQPCGWTKYQIIRVLADWSGASAHAGVSLDSGDLPEPAAADSEPPEAELQARELARTLLARLTGEEQELLRHFVIPNALGRVTLQEAAGKLGIGRSTLHDRANRLWNKLSQIGFEGELGRGAVAAFLDEIGT